MLYSDNLWAATAAGPDSLLDMAARQRPCSEDLAALQLQAVDVMRAQVQLDLKGVHPYGCFTERVSGEDTWFSYTTHEAMHQRFVDVRTAFACNDRNGASTSSTVSLLTREVASNTHPLHDRDPTLPCSPNACVYLVGRMSVSGRMPVNVICPLNIRLYLTGRRVLVRGAVCPLHSAVSRGPGGPDPARGSAQPMGHRRGRSHHRTARRTGQDCGTRTRATSADLSPSG